MKLIKGPVNSTIPTGLLPYKHCDAESRTDTEEETGRCHHWNEEAAENHEQEQQCQTNDQPEVDGHSFLEFVCHILLDRSETGDTDICAGGRFNHFLLRTQSVDQLHCALIDRAAVGRDQNLSCRAVRGLPYELGMFDV